MLIPELVTSPYIMVMHLRADAAGRYLQLNPASAQSFCRSRNR